ncbi:MAG: hypothetical protein HY758_02620 [Nitrospirae bacterium]|nr:hypothetical protein [Nitrospirota bacterium]
MNNIESEQGILYVATGKQYVLEANISVGSLKKVMPDVKTCLVTDGASKTLSSGYDNVIILSNPSFSYKDKISGMLLSPYKRTIFLDTDTYVIEPLGDLFNLLEYVDFAAAMEYGRSAFSADRVPESFPDLNTGVISFMNIEEVRDLLDRWRIINEEFDKAEIKIHDQPALRKALWESKIRFSVLPPEYNAIFRYPLTLMNKAKILHARTNIKIFKDAEKKINNKLGKRLTMWNGYTIDVLMRRKDLSRYSIRGILRFIIFRTFAELNRFIK